MRSSGARRSIGMGAARRSERPSLRAGDGVPGYPDRTATGSEDTASSDGASVSGPVFTHEPYPDDE